MNIITVVVYFAGLCAAAKSGDVFDPHQVNGDDIFFAEKAMEAIGLQPINVRQCIFEFTDTPEGRRVDIGNRLIVEREGKNIAIRNVGNCPKISIFINKDVEIIKKIYIR